MIAAKLRNHARREIIIDRWQLRVAIAKLAHHTSTRPRAADTWQPGSIEGFVEGLDIHWHHRAKLH
jgi:hypothetical protein